MAGLGEEVVEEDQVSYAPGGNFPPSLEASAQNCRGYPSFPPSGPYRIEYLYSV